MTEILNYNEYTLSEGIKGSPWVVVVVKDEYITIVSRPGRYAELMGIAVGTKVLHGEWVAVTRVEDVINQKRVFGLEMLQ